MRRSVVLIGLVVLGACRSYAGPADATVAAFVPDGLEIHATHRAEFEVDGRIVALTQVEYGELWDCSSGCVSSKVCAIEDGEEVHLFYASWTTQGEAPLGIEELCPGANLFHGETWPDCEPPGLTHPVTRTAEFAAFVDEQAGQGELRFCVNRYAGL